MTEKRVGNIGEAEYQKCVQYFEQYWYYFKEKNPHIGSEWMDAFFMIFLSGFSAGINVGETNKTTLIEEIIKSN